MDAWGHRPLLVYSAGGAVRTSRGGWLGRVLASFSANTHLKPSLVSFQTTMATLSTPAVNTGERATQGSENRFPRASVLSLNSANPDAGIYYRSPSARVVPADSSFSLAVRREAPPTLVQLSSVIGSRALAGHTSSPRTYTRVTRFSVGNLAC